MVDGVVMLVRFKSGRLLDHRKGHDVDMFSRYCSRIWMCLWNKSLKRGRIEDEIYIRRKSRMINAWKRRMLGTMDTYLSRGS